MDNKCSSDFNTLAFLMEERLEDENIAMWTLLLCQAHQLLKLLHDSHSLLLDWFQGHHLQENYGKDPCFSWEKTWVRVSTVDSSWNHPNLDDLSAWSYSDATTSSGPSNFHLSGRLIHFYAVVAPGTYYSYYTTYYSKNACMEHQPVHWFLTSPWVFRYLSYTIHDNLQKIWRVKHPPDFFKADTRH